MDGQEKGTAEYAHNSAVAVSLTWLRFDLLVIINLAVWNDYNLLLKDSK